MKAVALEKALHQWESEEHSVEEKLLALQKAVFLHLGLKEDPDYYIDKGKFFDRFVAGFVSSFFWRLKDLSFIVLDPLHIFDIITTFVKVFFTHPLKMLRQIFGTWTWSFTHGSFGMGMMVASALQAFIVAASVAMVAEGVVAGSASASTAVTESFASEFSYVSGKFSGVAQSVQKGASYTTKLFTEIQTNPQLILAEAKQSVMSGMSYGRIREFKFYANPFLKQSKA